jgi:carbamoyl-phosphate synthase large subunit
MSVCDRDKVDLLEVARAFNEVGFKILATGGTYDMIVGDGIPATKVKKLYEGRPNITDLIANGEISLIINTPAGKPSVHNDSYIRQDGTALVYFSDNNDVLENQLYDLVLDLYNHACNIA